MQKVHEQVCGVKGAPLARRLLQAGYYWETMSKDAQRIQDECEMCKMSITMKEVVMTIEYSDWRKFYIDYLAK